MAERPTIEQVREFKKAHGWRLMDRYGAHALGIGRSEGEGAEGEPVLLFYVERKAEAEERIPSTLSFRPREADREMEVPTRIVESPQARMEEG